MACSAAMLPAQASTLWVPDDRWPLQQILAVTRMWPRDCPQH